MIKSIPVKEILNNLSKDIVYRKVELQTELFKNKYQINELPTLLIFQNNKLLGKVEGYYSVNEKDKLIAEIRKVVDDEIDG